MSSPPAASVDTATRLDLESLLSERWQAPVTGSLAAQVAGVQDGPFISARRGRGLDFDDLRPYQAGDDLRHVDWKVSARTGQLHARLYREECDQRLSFGVDLRRVMFTGSQALLAVRVCRLTARWLWLATRAGFRVSVAVIDEQGCHTLPVRAGVPGALAGCRLLAERFAMAHAMQAAGIGAPARPQPPDKQFLQDLLLHWQGQARLSGMAVLLAHLPAGESRLDPALVATARALPLFVIQAEDPLEHRRLPAGRYRVNIQGRPQELYLDAAGAQSLALQLQAMRKTRQAHLHSLGIHSTSLHPGFEPLQRWLRDHRVLP